MAELVADCPRCGSRKITFDLTQEHFIYRKYDWQYWFEAFCICRHCERSTTFVLSQNTTSDSGDVHKNGLLKILGAVNTYMDIEGYISLKDAASIDPPEHLPEDIAAAFAEGAKCLAIGCYNGGDYVPPVRRPCNSKASPVKRRGWAQRKNKEKSRSQATLVV